MQTPSGKTTQTQAFSYSRVDFNKVNKFIIENPFSPYCYSNCDKPLETWYEWLHEIMLATILIRTNHRSSFPIWVTSPTSCIIRKLKSLQRKLNSEPSPALRNKIRGREDLVASKINEDLMLYEESIAYQVELADLIKVADQYNFDWKRHITPIEKRSPRTTTSSPFYLPKIGRSKSKDNFWYRTLELHRRLSRTAKFTRTVLRDRKYPRLSLEVLHQQLL